jgi:hypothetical protein
MWGVLCDVLIYAYSVFIYHFFMVKAFKIFLVFWDAQYIIFIYWLRVFMINKVSNIMKFIYK